MQEYEFKTEPFDHQLKIFQETKDFSRFALFWEMGCGKTKPVIDTFAYQVQKGGARTLVVLAPNGVHTNWITDEIPTHCPIQLRTFCWNSQKTGTIKFKKELKEFLAYPGPRIIALNYDAVMTKLGDKTIRKLIEDTNDAFLVLDESQYIKTPGAKRTMRIMSYVRYCEWRRILTGTPITNNPFDVYTQMKVLDLGYWKLHGLDNFTVFKQYFGIFQSKEFSSGKVELVVGFKNLHHLKELVAANSSRLLKEEVLTLPEKLYSKRYFEMNPEQRRVYDELKNDFITFLNGDVVTAELAIVRLQRLQQVTSGYLPSEDGETVHERIGGENRRMQCLEDVIRDVPHQGIIWAKYTRDIEDIARMLGDSCVTYYGATSNDDRVTARKRFRAGEVKWFVGNPDAAGTGLTLVEAKTVIYYNTSYKLASRLQSEDRAHRIGQKNNVNYTDIVALDSIDIGIVQSLVKKRELSGEVLGDELKEWI